MILTTLVPIAVKWSTAHEAATKVARSKLLRVPTLNLRSGGKKSARNMTQAIGSLNAFYSLSILAPVHLGSACLVLRLLVQTEIDTAVVIDTEVVAATVAHEGSF